MSFGGDHDRSDTYGIQRTSRDMIDTWRAEVASEDLIDLKTAYLHYSPETYGPEEW